MSLFQRLNGLLRLVWLCKHITRAAWRQCTGRFFVWREAPDVVVRFMCMVSVGRKFTHEEVNVAQFYEAARDEWRLRYRLRRQERGAR